MRSPRRVELPLYLVVLLLLALALNLVRGFDLARRRSAELQPWRTGAVMDLRTPDPGPPPEFSADQRFLLVRVEPIRGGRLALHQLFPERDVLRWMESESRTVDWLVLPLAGLPEGEFGFRWAEAGERAEATDPDWQHAPREWFGRFRLIRPR